MATTADRRRARRAAWTLVAVAASAVLAGCGGGDARDGTTKPKEFTESLTVYSSLPLSGPDSGAGEDILDGVRLAYAQSGGTVGRYAINLVSLNSLPGKQLELGNGQVALNARSAVTDPRTIAYIGDYRRPQTRISRGILDQAPVLQVAPSEGWDALPGGREPAPGFRTAYRARFGKDPGSEALFGYEAMNDILDAIERAGRQGSNRSAVADAFRAGPGN